MANIVELAANAGEDISQEVMLEDTQAGYVSLFGTTADTLDVQDAKVGELLLSTQTEIGAIVLTSGDPAVDVDPAQALEWLMRHRDMVDAAIAEYDAPAAE